MDNFRKFEKFGKYTLIKKIAVGGMAELFLVRTEKTAGISQFVVLKRILPQFSSNKKFRVMFKNEGKIASHLKHSNLVYHHEFGVDQGIYFIVMEYISGVSLKDFMKRVLKTGKKIPIPIVVTIIRSIASTLHYINNSINPETGQLLNLVHRDVTPHNVMIGFNGDIKLIDFGIAKVEGVDLTSAGVVKGKFSYMSPEQISGSKLSHRSDIFSLGVVFWELLSGRKLFNGPNIQSIFQKIKTSNIPSVTKYRPEIHPELSGILSQMLRKNISTRSSEAEGVERQLSLFLNKQHTNFSHLDFSGFIKKIYYQEIERERKFIVSINKELMEIQKEYGTTSRFLGKTITSEKSKESDVGISDVRVKTESSDNISKTIETRKQSKTRVRTNPFKAEPTEVSPNAPLSYSRTQIFKKNLDDDSIIVKQTDDEEHTVVDRSESLFSDLIGVYSERKKLESRKNHTWTLIALILIVGFVVVLFKYSPRDIIQNLSHRINQTNPMKVDFNDSLDSEPFTLDEEESLHLDEKTQEFPVPVEDVQEKTSSRNIANYDYFRIYVDTNPSGAFVKLNGQKINKKTPVFINVPNKPDNVLEVERLGYETYHIGNLNSSSEVKIKLKKLKKEK